jgi:hypothetical protein
MVNSKIDIYLNESNLLFIIYLKFICIYLNTGPIKIKNQKNKVSIIFEKATPEIKFNFIKFLFKPLNFFEINKVITNY